MRPAFREILSQALVVSCWMTAGASDGQASMTAAVSRKRDHPDADFSSGPPPEYAAVARISVDGVRDPAPLSPKEKEEEEVEADKGAEKRDSVHGSDVKRFRLDALVRRYSQDAQKLMEAQSTLDRKRSSNFSIYSIGSTERAHGVGQTVVPLHEVSQFAQYLERGDSESNPVCMLTFENETSFPARLQCVLAEIPDGSLSEDSSFPEFMIFPAKPLTVTVPVAALREFRFCIGGHVVSEKFWRFGDISWLRMNMGSTGIIAVPPPNTDTCHFVVYRKMGPQVAMWRSKPVDPSVGQDVR